MRNARNTERKVNAIINEILDEEQGNDATQSACPGGCEESDNTIKETPRRCNCAVENSLRFSIRVMEAMRSLQRDVNQPATSRVEDIVDYIRMNYRNNGDLDAQVRTALRQVCSQGFVMKLFDDEYHLIGPFVRSTKQRNGCNLDCTGRTSTTIDETSRRRRSINNGCFCKHISRMPYQPSHRDPRSLHEEFLKTSDRLEDGTMEPRFHSTKILDNEVDNDYRDRDIDSEAFCDCEHARDDRRQRGITKRIDQRDELLNSIPGPSREITRTPVSPKNARKKARLDDRTIKRADEDDEETTEEDLDCTCDVIQVTRDAQLKKQMPDRTRVVRGRRNGRRHKDVEDEDEEQTEEEEDGEKEEEEAEEEEDTNTEDSVYRQLRRRSPRRTRARERELKRWIRRCREECERRRAR